MYSNEIKNLTDSQLLKRTEELAREERRIQLDFIHHLCEIKRRQLHLSQGFESLFTYLTQGLGYDEGVAYRRIRAMELIQEMPEAEKALEQGRMTLTTLRSFSLF